MLLMAGRRDHTGHKMDKHTLGYPGCIAGIRVRDKSATGYVIDFSHSYNSDVEEGEEVVVKFTGPVRVAVMSNDSRINPPYIREISLGTLTGTNRLTNWNLPFHGLEPNHYYALVLYSPGHERYDISTPFSRKCFLTSDSK